MAIEYVNRRFSVDEYERLVEVGIIGEDERVELVDGQIVAMPPSGEAHSGGINALIQLFILCFAGRAVVQPQLPVRVGDYSLPEPDLALLRPEPTFYRNRRPLASDVLAFVEVAYSSVRFDLGTKLRVYAQARIPEYWVVDVRNNRILVHEEPHDLGYAVRREIGPGERVAFRSFPSDPFAAEEILPTVGGGITEDGGDDPYPTSEPQPNA